VAVQQGNNLPKNDDVHQINEIMLNLLPGAVQTFYSIDQVNYEDARVPIEIVNKLNPQGMPLHVISLKLGSIIMLLRNLNPADGHCNGTRYIVTNMAKHVIEAVIPDGIHKGKVLYIPRIYNTPPKNFSPTMTRIQFPIKLAFAITSNKSQGQSLESIGIYLNTGEFKAH
jgi:ATP-dependent DNA helicase PIF1